ncbi:MAG: exo-beta-N-acetylmuramidase NamZ domain-containing protein [bacterium]|jgi:uncharacterized protein YbbC (DUF1343 family)|nr:DUF1343 domain-containing protein [Bacillota bacterium]HHW55697.1 DUF1343 domain-containing protein [Bacillota bacterium]
MQGNRSGTCRFIAAVVLALLLAVTLGGSALGASPRVKLGNEVLLEKFRPLVAGKRVGLVTNQTGVNGRGESLIDILYHAGDINLVALYGPEHGIDGRAKAGEYVASYTHPRLKIPVYSLYGATRMPTPEMLAGIDVLVFDIQDIGARSYTYMSTLNYCLVAAQREGLPVLVLDRPNPLGGLTVEGPVMEDRFISFVGVDNLPMAHGMTAGELARFFNRKIGAELLVIPMEGYSRDMIFQDTGLPFVQTSPNIPDLVSAFGYMATGLGEGTGVGQRDQFKWIGGTGIDSEKFASLLNRAGLAGVRFIPDPRGSSGGVKLEITDYRTFNPARTGLYALAYAKQLKKDFKVPKSGETIVMFDKIMGTATIGQYLEQNRSPQEIEASYQPQLEKFKREREKYLIYGSQPLQWPDLGKEIVVFVDGVPVIFDVAPHIDANDRTMVPVRAIAEALGAEVKWDGASRKVTIVRGGRELVLTIDNPKATINGKTFTMDTRPVIRQGRTMVPLRFVGELLGVRTVDWDGRLRLVKIYN